MSLMSLETKSQTKQPTFRISEKCSSAEVAEGLQIVLNKLYVPDEDGDFFCSTKDEAMTLLLSTQKMMHNFLKRLVTQYEDEFEALAELAEVDHRLEIPDQDFTIDYDTEGGQYNSDVPYTLNLQYGDPNLGYVRMSMNAMSQ